MDTKRNFKNWRNEDLYKNYSYQMNDYYFKKNWANLQTQIEIKCALNL